MFVHLIIHLSHLIHLVHLIQPIYPIHPVHLPARSPIARFQDNRLRGNWLLRSS
jgi:hypothetical protein